jgi:hypothetical protein
VNPVRWFVGVALWVGGLGWTIPGQSAGAREPFRVNASPLESPVGSPDHSLQPTVTLAENVSNIEAGQEAEETVITSETFSTTRLTLPSLWWVKDQFAHKEPLAVKLLQNWRAYPGSSQQPGRIDLLVNRQFWSLLDYVERYTFLNEFGATAREYGYNIRVLDSNEALRREPLAEPIASYICNFNAIPVPVVNAEGTNAEVANTEVTVVVPKLDAAVNPLPCQISLDSAGKAGFRGGANLPASGTKGLGTAGP